MRCLPVKIGPGLPCAALNFWTRAVILTLPALKIWTSFITDLQPGVPHG